MNIAIFHQLTERYQTGGLSLAEEPQVIVVMLRISDVSTSEMTV